MPPEPDDRDNAAIQRLQQQASDGVVAADGDPGHHLRGSGRRGGPEVPRGLGTMSSPSGATSPSATHATGATSR